MLKGWKRLGRFKVSGCAALVFNNALAAFAVLRRDEQTAATEEERASLTS